MIEQIKLKMKVNGDIRPDCNWAYNLYGALMEKIDTEYAELLHYQGIKPVSQYLEVISHDNNNQIIWTVNLLGEEAIEQISPLIKSIGKYYIEKYKTGLSVENVIRETVVTEDELVEKFLLGGSPERKVNIFHLTPCSFKSNEQYVIFPSVELIIKSAVQKWNSFAKETVIDDLEAIGQLINNTWISGYNLKSSYYLLKDNKIPAFLGRTCLGIRGPEPMIRLFNLLIHFIEYSGLGIKASLGMGGCKIS